MIDKNNKLNSKKEVSKENTYANSISNKSLSVSSLKISNFNFQNNNQESAKVVLRIKSKTEDEYLEKEKIFEIKENTLIEIAGSKNNTKLFKFDYIFNEDSQQIQIFEICSKDICDSLFEGYNGTIFTYGQINSGKTYTMLGPDYTNSFLINSNFILPEQENKYISYIKRKEEEGKGLISRTIEYLLDKKEELCKNNEDINLKIEIFCSFYEIFNEQIYDLFNNSSWINNNSLFKEKGIEGTSKEYLKKIKVNDKKDICELIKVGNYNRKTFYSIMNSQLKSHSIFSIILNMSKKENGNIIINKSILNLVILAASENKSSINNDGDKIKDNGKINKFLLGLGNVIQNVGENFIPFRDTKLTYLLKESLGINSKTCFIITISSSKKNLQDTLFSLNFSQNIKKFKTKLNNKFINSKKNKLIEEEKNHTIANEDIINVKKIYNNYIEEITDLINILQQLGENSQEINKFKEKFMQNSAVKKYLNEDYEKFLQILINKEKEIKSLEEENEIYENKINSLNIELIIKEQTYNNLIKRQSYAEKEFSDMKKEFDIVYDKWNAKINIMKDKNNILIKQKKDNQKIQSNKKDLIDKNKEIIASKDIEIDNMEKKINELENIINTNSLINAELEKEIYSLKEEIKILNINYDNSEKELETVRDKLLNENKELKNVDYILNNNQKLYKDRILNDKGNINKLNSMINQSSSNEIESKNKIFIFKNKIVEYDLYLRILNKTKEILSKSLDDLEKSNNNYRNELNEKINSYNNLIEINKDLKNKLDLLNKRFELIGGNKNNNKEKETKSKIIKLKEENNELLKDISLSENVLSNINFNKNNVFQYQKNIEQKVEEYKKLFSDIQKELIPIIEKDELRKSLTVVEKIRNNKNIKENERMNILAVSLENAICLLKEKEELIKNKKIYNENIRLKTISSFRENNIKNNDINLKDKNMPTHRNSIL